MARSTGDWRIEGNGFPKGKHAENRLIGRAPAMRRLFEHIEIIGDCDATVLIEGETGVGKNRVANLVHLMSARAERPFVHVNAATLPQELFESELFGHAKGAFTGAYQNHKGLARMADGGTIFIDEIGELSPANQVKLLSFLDQKQVRPVGGLRQISVDLRVIAATNRDLGVRVRSGEFRRDLYYRLRVFPLHVPSLRERLEDVPLLAGYLLDKYNRKYGKRLPGFTRDAMSRLREWSWGGNVRELENVVEHAVILTPEGRNIEAETFSLRDDSLAPEPAGEERAMPGRMPLRTSRSEAERRSIVRALDRRRWNVSAAARDLDISRVGLTRKLKRMGISRPGTAGESRS